MQAFRTLSFEDLVVVRRIAARFRAGCTERYSPAKSEVSRRNARLASAKKLGDLALYWRLKWQFYPEKCRKMLALGQCPPKPEDLP